MNAFTPVDPAHATGRTKELLDTVRATLGVVPNMTRHMARSPAVLEAYLGLAGALARGALDAKIAERIALLTAETNGCAYCLAAHSLLGRRAGLSAADVAAARAGEAADPQARAALRLARAVLAGRGRVRPDEVDAMRDAGFDEGAIGEVVAHVALNVLTNYFNNLTRPAVDFPPAAPRLPKAA